MTLDDDHRRKMLAGRIALITGAAQGIGLATARLLLRNGARISMVDVMDDVGKISCAVLQNEFSKDDVQFLKTDVTNSEQLKSAFSKTKEVFGKIDIVMNNAGMADESQWMKMVALNLVAVMEGTYLGIEYMSTRTGGGGGSIINVASFGGIVPMSFSPAYCASKHGVVGFTRSMTTCTASDSVRVNCICPEFVNTKLVTDSKLDKNLLPNMSLLEPEDIAEGVLELIMDTSQVGKVMTVTKGRGKRYISLLGDPKPKL